MELYLYLHSYDHGIVGYFGQGDDRAIMEELEYYMKLNPKDRLQLKRIKQVYTDHPDDLDRRTMQYLGHEAGGK